MNNADHLHYLFTEENICTCISLVLICLSLVNDGVAT